MDMSQRGQAKFSCRAFLFAISFPWIFSSVHTNFNHHLLRNLRMTFHVCSSCFCLLSSIITALHHLELYLQCWGSNLMFCPISWWTVRLEIFLLLFAFQISGWWTKGVRRGIALEGEEHVTVRLLLYSVHKGARGNNPDPEDRSYYSLAIRSSKRR